MNRPDNAFKIIILIFFGAFYELISFIIETVYIPRNIEISKTVNLRLNGILIIFSSLLCYFILRIKILKHQKYSLISIGICSIFVLIFDLIFLGKKQNIKFFFFTYFLVIIRLILLSFKDVIEKYLFEYDFINPFKCNMFEGLINTFLTLSLFFIVSVSSEDINNLSDIISSRPSIIIFLIIYLLISGLKNTYRVITIKIYSPMTRALCESLLDPFLVVYYLFQDENIKDSLFWIYCGVTLLASIIMPISSCIYNEFIILYCYDLEYETHLEITKRAQMIDGDFIEKKDLIELGDYYTKL